MEYDLKTLNILIVNNDDHNLERLKLAVFNSETLEDTIKGNVYLKGKTLIAFKGSRIGPTNLHFCFSADILSCKSDGEKYPIPQPFVIKGKEIKPYKTKIKYRLNKIVFLNEIHEDYIEK
ncbi:MAG: hypothetical protein V1663_02430 [archaeon]